LPSKKREFLPESLNPFHKLRCPARLPDLPGSSGPLLEASSSTERSTSGFPIFSQVTAKKRGLSKVEDFKANPSLFGESMDLSELSDGIPRGEAQKVEDSQNMPIDFLFPLCYSS